MTTSTQALTMTTTKKITQKKTTQPELLLISDETTSPSRWTLDEQTKAVGRKGIAAARAALRQPTHLDLAA